MRLLIISHEYEPIASGGVTLIKELSHHLVKIGFEIVILTPRLPGTLKYETVYKGVEIIRCNTLRLSRGNANIFELVTFALLSIPTALRIIKKYKIDVILSIFLVPSGFSGVVASHLSGIPHTVFIGGADIPGVSSKFGRFLQKIKFLLRSILRCSDGILVAEGLEKYVNGIDPSAKLNTVRNGADVKKIKPLTKSIKNKSEKKINILSIGRLINRKGFLYIIEALGLLSREKCDRIYLSIIGYGPLKNILQTRIHELGLENNVNLLGMIPKEKLDYHYRSADYYMFYSEPEGNSLALVEAMAYGLPIITSDVPGNKELFDKNGFIVPYGDSHKLSEVLLKLPDIAYQSFEKWSIQSRMISEKYDWHEISRTYSEVLKSAVKKNKAMRLCSL